MTKEEAKEFGLRLLHGIMERNESYPVYANNVKQAIDALSEPSCSSEIPNDLEEAAKKSARKEFRRPYSDTPDEPIVIIEPDHYEGFIAGAKWDREQMMKEAVEYDVVDFALGECHPHINVPLDSKEFKNGDKVKLIIIKEDKS